MSTVQTGSLLGSVAIGKLEFDAVASLTALRAINTGDNGVLPLLAHGSFATVVGVGAGEFDFDAYSSAAHNGGTVIAPIDGRGRWIRRTQGRELNVLDFGAVGDGVTDDSAAIQAAIDEAAAGDFLNARRGLGVYLPAGDYRVDSKITLKTGVRLHGESQSSVRILSYVEDDDVLFYDADATAANVIKTVAIADLAILARVASTGAYIHLTGAAQVHQPSIARVYIYGGQIGAVGMRVKNAQQGHYELITVQSCTGDGFKLEATNNVGVFTSCYATMNGGDGYDIVGTQMSFTSCAADKNDGHGYRIAGNGFTFISPEAEDNAGDIMYITANYVTIISGVLYGSDRSQNGITLDAGAAAFFMMNTSVATQAGVPAGYAVNLADCDMVTLWQNIIAAFTAGTINNPAALSYVDVPTTAGITCRSIVATVGASSLKSLNLSTVAEYADNAAAIANGLVAGDFYRTADALKIVHA